MLKYISVFVKYKVNKAKPLQCPKSENKSEAFNLFWHNAPVSLKNTNFVPHGSTSCMFLLKLTILNHHFDSPSGSFCSVETHQFSFSLTLSVVCLLFNNFTKLVHLCFTQYSVNVEGPGLMKHTVTLYVNALLCWGNKKKKKSNFFYTRVSGRQIKIWLPKKPAVTK